MAQRKRYYIVATNANKIGRYYFTGFNNMGVAQYETNWAPTKNVKLFGTKPSMEKVLKRLKKSYKDKPQIKFQAITIERELDFDKLNVEIPQPVSKF